MILRNGVLAKGNLGGKEQKKPQFMVGAADMQPSTSCDVSQLRSGKSWPSPFSKKFRKAGLLEDKFSGI